MDEGADDLNDEPSDRDLFSMGEDEADPPGPIAARLVAGLPEFEHLLVGEPAILFLMRRDPQIKAERAVLGTMALPRFMGSNAKLATWLLAKACDGVVPDFIMTLDAEWWRAATPLQREALVHHELLHADHAKDRDGERKFTDEGRPVWAVVGHDIEEFNETARRYGAWTLCRGAFLEAMIEGEARRTA